MADLSCYIVTFNCGRTLLDADFFATTLFDGLDTASSAPPDVLVLALQEVAPIAYSFLGGTLLSPYFSRFRTAVQSALAHRFGPDAQAYDALAIHNVGMTGLMVLVQPELHSRIVGIETAGVGVGWWEMGNKGAVGVRLTVHDAGEQERSKITFVAAHLAPMEDRCERRNQDWKDICKGLVFEGLHGLGDSADQEEAEHLLSDNESSDSQQTLYSPASYLFFAGDLNYRTADSAPKPMDYRNWPTAVNNIAPYAALLKRDQLTRERTQNRTLHHLGEAPITFSPTYKYASEAQKHALDMAKSNPDDGGGDADQSQVQLWAKHRVPSWCDRILYLSSMAPKVHKYTSLPVQPTSDHRPVVLSCTVQLEDKSYLLPVSEPFTIRSDWKSARAAARRWEIMVGIIWYLGLTWEGEMLLAGTTVGLIGGYVVIRSMIGV